MQQLSTLILPTQLQNTAIFVVFLLIVFLRRRASSGGWWRGRDHAGQRSLLPILILPRPMRRSRSSLPILLPADADVVLVWASFGLSWNVLSGYTGLVSFGHAAFFGIGAYTTALGQIHSISRRGC